MRRTALLLFITAALLAGTAMAGPQQYCTKNYRKLYSSRKECLEKEAAAQNWLSSRSIDPDILAGCSRKKGPGEVGSYVLTKRCVEKETERHMKRAESPFNLENSRIWYAPILRKHFPSIVRACGIDRPRDSFAVLPKDITRFKLRREVVYREMLPVLHVDGSVRIGALAGNFRAKKGYIVHIDAMLFSDDGRLMDVRSVSPGGKVMTGGGVVGFSFSIGRGYYFEKGGTLLVTASGEPIESDYPATSCVMIGAKRIRLR